MGKQWLPPSNHLRLPRRIPGRHSTLQPAPLLEVCAPTHSLRWCVVVWCGIDKMFTRTGWSMGEKQPYIQSGETSFRLAEEVEYLVPPSNDYPY